MKHSIKMKLSLISFLIAVGVSCNQNPKYESDLPTQKEVNRSMEDVNRQFAKDEAAQIDGYIARRGWKMKTTGTGLRFMIEHSTDGDSIKMGDVVEVNFEVSLLNGDLVYTSDENGTRAIEIGKANIESGLHEGLQLMKVGESAMFILPSHLAHGLTGDNQKIPPRSSVVYDIDLIRKL